MLLATALVTVLPAVLVGAALPANGLGGLLASIVLAMAISALLGQVGAAVWKRHPASRDLVFADLMLWGWLRRVRAQRRLARVRRSLAGSTGVELRFEDLERVSRMLEARDATTHGHSQRVARHAERIARAMRLPRADVARIRTAALVHDVGKVHTPPAILTKPGRLTDAEFDVIKRHPVDGARMLRSVGDPELVAIVRHHHERLDGAGYPGGLAGSAIPLGARIVAVADTFDAITSTRPYRSPGNHKKALDILAAEAGTQLDAAAVAAFLSYYAGRRPVLWTALAAAVPQRLVGWIGQTSGALAGGAASLLPVAGLVGLAGISSGLRVEAPASAMRAPSAITATLGPTSLLPLSASTGNGADPGGAGRRSERHRAEGGSRGPATSGSGSASAAPAAPSVASPGNGQARDPKPDVAPPVDPPRVTPSPTSVVRTVTATVTNAARDAGVPVPDVQVPDVPAVAGVATPKVALPAVSVPVAGVTVPSVQVPAVRLPAIAQ